MTAPQQVNGGRVVAGVLFTGLGVALLLDSLGAWTIQPVGIWPLVLIALGTSVLLGKRQRERVEEDRSAQLAVAEERVRIARELHDIVAHGVSLMIIQIAAARRVHKKKPEAAEEALETAERTGRQALAELRTLLAVLRGADQSIEAAAPARPSNPGTRSDKGMDGEPDLTDRRDPLPGLSEIGNLVEDVRNAGLSVALTVSGVPPATAPSEGLAVYRVVQESLTNALRHAPDAQVGVEITYTPTEVIVFVDDDGTGATGPGHGGARHGLLGMRERVAAVGGILEAGPRTPGPGWRVHARIPLTSVLT